MSFNRKGFFSTRQASDMRALHRVIADKPSGLISLIDGVNPSAESVVVGSEVSNGFLVPESFVNDKGCRVFIKSDGWSSYVSNRRHFRNVYSALSQPSYERGKVAPLISGDEEGAQVLKPLDSLRKLLGDLSSVTQEDLFFVGYSYHSLEKSASRDTNDFASKVLVPLTSIFEGAWIAAYLSKLAKESEGQMFAESDERVTLTNPDSADVDGANVNFVVPSRSASNTNGNYRGRVLSIPVSDTRGDTRVLRNAWALRTKYDDDNDFSHNCYWSLKARIENHHDLGTVGFSPLSPHCVAAIYEAQRVLSRRFGTMVPFDYSTIFVPSKEMVRFYQVLINNVLVYDPSHGSSDHLRTLSNNELSTLLFRKMVSIGPDRTLQSKDRDGKVRDYDWGVK